jgi:5-methylcytosine-specific restriction protein A
MDLLAYWRFDNYRRDLDGGAGFHFNSNQPRLHTAICPGESLWLFTRIVCDGLNQYRLLARLVVSAKTINAPGYKYGAYRAWGNLLYSYYFKVRPDATDDIFELLRVLEFEGSGLENKNRSSLAQACQTIREIKPSASALLAARAEQLAPEPRAKAVPNEETLEAVLVAEERAQLQLLLKEEGSGYTAEAKTKITKSHERNRQLASELNRIYSGRCQVTGHDSPVVYGVPTAEAHHIDYRSRGGEDSLENLVLVCPNVHRAIHAGDAKFDYGKLSFLFGNGRVEPLVINRHLKTRVA